MDVGLKKNLVSVARALPLANTEIENLNRKTHSGKVQKLRLTTVSI